MGGDADPGIPVPRGIWDRSQVGWDERSFGMNRSLWNSSGAGSRFLSPRSRDSHPKIPRILRRTPNLGPFPARFSLGDAPGSGDGSQVSPCLPPAPSAPREMWEKKGIRCVLSGLKPDSRIWRFLGRAGGCIPHPVPAESANLGFFSLKTSRVLECLRKHRCSTDFWDESIPKSWVFGTLPVEYP